MRARAFLRALSALAVAGLLAACDQGKGDVCQVDSDCEPPLVCSASMRQCVTPGSGGDLDASILLDAAGFPDGGPRDAGPIDAAPEVDAAPEIDAGPELDAAPADAAL